MNTVKGTIEATIQLTNNNCYYMSHGVCSLSLVEDHFVSTTDRLAQNDWMYCPRLYKLMLGKEKEKAIPATPCDCGHVEILSNPQRACIAERKNLVLSLAIKDDQKERALCSVCGGQTTLQGKEATGKRILSLTVRAVKSE